jgi:type I restriction enzyme S subunit
MTRPTATPSDSKPALTPKLRFPEFRNGPAWNGTPMGKAYSFQGNNSLSRDQLNYEHGSVKNIHYGDIHTKFSTLFDVTKETVPFINPSESLDGLHPENDCVEGDMIFADASEDLADIGKSIEIVRLNGERVVSGQHTILARPIDDNLTIGFGAYLFKSTYVRTQIQKESQGSKVLGISATRLTKIQLPIPHTKAEQQKIAECLSTLDELIGAESQKLDALKAHKKGLMQQLFPREGETLPRLRFPEFQFAQEWEPKSLGAVAESLDNRRVPITEKDRAPGSIPYYGASGIVDYVRDHLFDEDLLCVSEDGANLVARTYPIAFSISGKTWVNNHAHVLRFENPFTQKIVEDYLNSIDLGDYLTGMAQPKLNKAMLGKIPIPLPNPDEQQRIATCLSSLDDLIAAQSEQLAALQTHKQGLMQQLFPSPADAPE